MSWCWCRVTRDRERVTRSIPPGAWAGRWAPCRGVRGIRAAPSPDARCDRAPSSCTGSIPSPLDWVSRSPTNRPRARSLRRCPPGRRPSIRWLFGRTRRRSSCGRSSADWRSKVASGAGRAATSDVELIQRAATICTRSPTLRARRELTTTAVLTSSCTSMTITRPTTSHGKPRTRPVTSSPR